MIARLRSYEPGIETKILNFVMLKIGENYGIVERKNSYKDHDVIYVEHGTRALSAGAFFGCMNLRYLILPNTIAEIYQAVCFECINLTEINMGWTDIIRIPSGAFNGCENLRTVIMPPNLNTIGTKAFWNCKRITALTIPETVTFIGTSVFAQCISLRWIILPSSIEVMGDWAFQGCSNLRTLLVRTPSKITGVMFTRIGKKWINLTQEQLNTAFRDLIPDVSKNNIRIWSSDTVISMLQGSFDGYTKYSDLPQTLQAAPTRIQSWSALERWRWWSPPDIEIPTHKYHLMVWTALLVSERHLVTDESNSLYIVSEVPQEIWMLIFEFIKRDEPVYFH